MITTIPIDDHEATVYRCNAELRDELAEKDRKIRRLEGRVELLEALVSSQNRVIATWERAWGGGWYER